MITISQRATDNIINRQPVDQRTVVIVSDSSLIPQQSQRLWFTQDQRKLLYKGEQVSGKGGLQKVIIDSDAQADADMWYLCSQPVQVVLPSSHQQNDCVKVSSILGNNLITVLPYSGDTIQSDSGFQLDVVNGSAEFMWDGGKWIIVQCVVPEINVSGGGGVTIAVSAQQPQNPSEGTIWIQP